MPFKAGAIIATTAIDQAGFKSGMSSLKKVATVGGAAIAGAFVAAMGSCIKATDSFKKEISNVSTIIDTSVISVGDLEKQVLELDPALGSASEMTKALYQSFSSGAETAKEAMQVTVDAAKFAKAGLTSNAVAVDVLTTATNAYGKSVMNTTKASDIFFKGIQKGKLTGDQLASTIGDSIPLFASTKIKMEELVTGMAALTKQGVNAANSTTQLNAIVNAFLKPSEAMAEALKNIGYESGSAFLEANGLKGALQLLEDQTNGDAAAMAELLPNIRALRGAMALTGTGGKEFNSILAEMADVSGMTQEAFDKQEKTTDTFKNQLENLKITIGSLVKEYFDKAVVSLTNVMKKIQTFLTSAEGIKIVNGIIKTGGDVLKTLGSIIKPITVEVKGLVNDFMNLSPATQKVIIGIGLLTTTIKPAITIVGKLSTALTFLSAHPAVAVVAAIVGIAGVINSLNREERELNKLIEDTARSMTELSPKGIDLVNELDNLRDQTDLTVEQQQRQYDIIESLRELYPNMTEEILRNSAALKLETIAQEKDNLAKKQAEIDRLKNELSAYNEELEKEYKNYKVILDQSIINQWEKLHKPDNLVEGSRAFTKYNGELADVRESLYNITSFSDLKKWSRENAIDISNAIYQVDVKYSDLQHTISIGEVAITEMNNEIEKQETEIMNDIDVMEELRKRQDAVKTGFEDATGATDDYTDAVNNATDATDDYIDEAALLAQQQKEVAESLARIEIEMGWDAYNERMKAYWAEIEEKQANEEKYGQYLFDIEMKKYLDWQNVQEMIAREREAMNKVAMLRSLEWNNQIYANDQELIEKQKELIEQRKNNYAEYGQYITDVELEVWQTKQNILTSEEQSKEIHNKVSAMRLREWREAETKIEMDELDQRRKNYALYQKDMTNAELAAWEKEQKAIEDKEKRYKLMYENIVSMISTAMSVITSFIDTGLQNEINALTNSFDSQKETRDEAHKKEIEDIDSKYKKLIEEAEKNGEDTTEIEKEYRDKKEDVEKKYNDNEEKLKKEHNDELNVLLKKQFDNEQMAKRGEAVISAGKSIMGWWEQAPQLGPVAGPIFAGVMTTLTGAQLIAQLADIDAQQFVPRKTGGKASGPTRVYEDGGEIINLPSGSFVIPNDISENMMGNKNEINVNFAGAYINSELDLDMITNHVSQKLARQLR